MARKASGADQAAAARALSGTVKTADEPGTARMVSLPLEKPVPSGKP